jgi:ribosomal protein S6--L-glutamate ligase
MKIALLARNPHLYSHRRICEAARARGHEIEVVNTLRVSINITSRRPALYYRKRRLEDFDAVIPRIGASVTFYGLAVLRQFEVMGVYPLNESVAIGRSRDKLRCLQLLARRGIGLPVTAFTHDPRQAEDIIDLVGGAPVVIKLLEGTQGIGVVLGETVKSAKSVIEAFQGVNVNILVQQFIKEADSTDIRALVIDSARDYSKSLPARRLARISGSAYSSYALNACNDLAEHMGGRYLGLFDLNQRSILAGVQESLGQRSA